MIWNAVRESESPAKRRDRQLAELKDLAARLYNRVEFYKTRFDEAGVKPTDIVTLEDISKIPFTTKDDLRDTYPYGLLAADHDDIVEIHTSSGTTGTPVVDAYTRNDMDVWSEVMARCLMMAGAEKGDVVQNGYGYGMFTGGLGVHYGAHAIGCNTIPIGGGNTERQLQLMRDFGSTILTCTPSYSLYMAEVAKDMGIDMESLSIKSGIFGAEPWSENMRREIEEKMHLKAYDIYGLTEIIGPGVSCECGEQNGLHVNEDHFYPEIIDPETGKVLPEGEKGELVFTTLTKTGTPILRYRTRDITWLERGECACGRNLVKMHRLLGRTDDMMIIRGVNVFPSQIEHILMDIEETQPHYQIVIDRVETYLDDVELRVEVEPQFFSDETKELERISRKIAEAMKNKLGLNLHIKLVEPKSIERSMGKAKRVIDKRTL
ncbi:MAG: phenylacetate--CoA ligase [Spirochaetaceae bacterium]|nr:phenylacetate--CoA ligase [Spirochaetaceae bacterium]MDT8297409.1 phenylacetate--CoA ligase [Spirochaetaceae bacterium]